MMKIEAGKVYDVLKSLNMYCSGIVGPTYKEGEKEEAGHLVHCTAHSSSALMCGWRLIGCGYQSERRKSAGKAICEHAQIAHPLQSKTVDLRWMYCGGDLDMRPHGPETNICTWLREFCRQVQEEMISYSSNTFH